MSNKKSYIEHELYLSDHCCVQYESEEERRLREDKDRLYSQTPEKAKEKIRLLQRKLIYTGMFLTRKGLYEEADDFVSIHMDEPVPFEDEW